MQLSRIAGATLLSVALMVGPVAAEEETSFEVSVTGDVEFSWEAEDARFIRAIHDPTSGDKQLRLELRPGGKNQEVVLQVNVVDAAVGDEEGTYDVGLKSGGSPPSMASIACEGVCTSLMIPILGADTGTVTIEQADAEIVSGTFEFRAEGLKVGERVVKPAFEAKGAFVAAVID